MKKKLMAILLAGCMMSLTACSINVNTNGGDAVKQPDADVEQENTQENTQEQPDDSQSDEGSFDDSGSAKEITAGADGTLSNGLFSVTVPKDLDGIYIALSTDNSIEFFDKDARDGGFGGYVFSVQAYAEPSDYAGGLDVKKGEIHTGDKIYDITVMEASDVEWDYEKYPGMPETYEKIYGHKDDIVNSVKPDGDGEYIAGAGTKGEELYGEVIEQFRKAIAEGWDANKLEKSDMSPMYYAMSQYDASADVMDLAGYAFLDLNSDGVDEFVAGEIADGDWKGVIYDIYTMVDRKPVHVVSGSERDRYYALEGGLISNEASGGAELTEVVSYYITPNSTDRIPQLAVKYDAYDDKDNPWFVSFDYDKGEWEKVSESEFNEYLERISRHVSFDYTPFSK